MKTKHIIFFTLALILLTSFVLAEDNNSLPSSPTNESQPCTTCGNATRTCVDSDGGLNYYVQGSLSGMCTAETTCGAWVDSCIDSKTLLEYSCGNANGERHTCPNGCVNGACVNYQGYNMETDKAEYGNGDTILLTISSSNGMKGNVDLYVQPSIGYGSEDGILIKSNLEINSKGTYKIRIEDFPKIFDETDQYLIVVSAAGEKKIGGVNTNSIVVKVSFPQTAPVKKCGTLIYFCSDNSPYCTMSAPEMDKFIQNPGCVKATKYILSDFMKLGQDSLAVKYGVNGVPTFLFIDENGCFGDIGKGGGTKVEDIKNGINNFVCGGNPSPTGPSTPDCPIMTCVGGYKVKAEIVDGRCSYESCPAIPIEPNSTTGPIEIPIVEDNKTINYACTGCSLDNKCYPMGYRKSGNFCKDDGKFTVQLNSDKTCENNFECSSNVCVSGKCVSSSMIDKILGWFKRLFGSQ